MQVERGHLHLLRASWLRSGCRLFPLSQPCESLLGGCGERLGHRDGRRSLGERCAPPDQERVRVATRRRHAAGSCCSHATGESTRSGSPIRGCGRRIARSRETTGPYSAPCSRQRARDVRLRSDWKPFGGAVVSSQSCSGDPRSPSRPWRFSLTHRVLAADGVPVSMQRPVVLDMHNIESELMSNYATSSKSRWKALLAGYEAWRLRLLESAVGKTADLVAVVSQHDEARIRTLWAGKENATLIVAPNGVDDAGFEVRAERQREVVFVAHLGWAPNVDAAEWLCHEVWPLVRQEDSSVQLNLIGRSPAKRVLRLEDQGIRVIPDVESTLPYVARACVATAPLLAAGGTRLKILEALSCGTPVVATRLGALGLEHIEPSALTIADDAPAFASSILRAIENPPMPDRIRPSAHEFRWSVSLSGLISAIRLIGSSDRT